MHFDVKSGTSGHGLFFGGIDHWRVHSCTRSLSYRLSFTGHRCQLLLHRWFWSYHLLFGHYVFNCCSLGVGIIMNQWNSSFFGYKRPWLYWLIRFYVLYLSLLNYCVWIKCYIIVTRSLMRWNSLLDRNSLFLLWCSAIFRSVWNLA